MMLAAIALSAAGTAGWAHSKAETTIPADGTTVAEVEEILIRFDEPMRVTAIALMGPGGDLDIARETDLDPTTEFRAIPPAAMPAGAYQVEWRGLSADGHPMQGTFGFTVAD
jgi:methionine-rich copper-binding protein CopC